MQGNEQFYLNDLTTWQFCIQTFSHKMPVGVILTDLYLLCSYALPVNQNHLHATVTFCLDVPPQPKTLYS